MLTFLKKLPAVTRFQCVTAGSASLVGMGFFFASVVQEGTRVNSLRLAFLVAITMGCAGLALSVVRNKMAAFCAAAFLCYAIPIWASHFMHTEMTEFTLAIAVCGTAVGATRVLYPQPLVPESDQGIADSPPGIAPADRYPRLR